MPVSVVLPTHGRAALLPVVIPPLLDDHSTHEVIVVVDGSPDDSLGVLTAMAARDPRLRPVAADKIGKARARQAGIERATGDVVLLLDDDVLAAPGLVSGHWAHHASGDIAGLVVVGYMPVRVPDRRLPGEVATRLYAHEYEQAVRGYERDPGSILPGLWGGNVSLPREDCLRVGVVAPGAPDLTRHDDMDFGIRCARAGLRGVFDRSLAARHLHDRSLDGFAREAREQGFQRHRLHRKYPEALGPLEPHAFESGLPAPAVAVMRATRRPGAARAVSGALGAVASRAGSARAWGIETVSAKLLRRVEQQRGAIEAAREVAAGA
jgi:glycosyltransferase involved in cell wall biosynthesis